MRSTLAEWFSLPGIVDALIDSYETDAEVMDPRILGMLQDGQINPALKLRTDDGRMVDAVDLLDGKSAKARTQDWSRRQPHSVAMRRSADRLRAGEEFGIGASRFLRVTGNAPVFGLPMGELMKSGAVVRQPDMIRLGRPGDQLHQ